MQAVFLGESVRQKSKLTIVTDLEGQYSVSGVVGTLVEDTRFEENSVCGVCKGIFG